MSLNGDKHGVTVRCSVCHMMKKPIGRSAPLEMWGGFCDDDCPGYRLEPRPGSLWPHETELDFGYPVGDDGTNLAAVPPAPPPEQRT